MNYQSLGFLCFAAVVMAVYYTIGRKRQTAVIAFANLAFYAIVDPVHLPFLTAVLLGSFFAARRIGRIYREADQKLAGCAESAQKKQIRAEAGKRAKKALYAGMAVGIVLLAVGKYTAFAMENLNAVLGLFGLPGLTVFRMVMPLGISFYVFMAIGYLLDVYWKRYPAEDGFVKYAAYLAWFPHVIQGPIDRYNEFSAQLRSGVPFSAENLASGAQLALWGFFKKLVIADRLAILVNAAFASPEMFAGFPMIASLAAYSVQIYADFSGCIDIVTGVSEMFGIHLRKNFNHPYFSRSMGEFWRRWHISLQEWFKDYVYFPVSTSNFVKTARRSWMKRGKPRAAEILTSCFPIFVVWLISGIWHGAAWKFVIWGMFHAALLIGSNLLEPAFAAANRTLRVRTSCAAWRGWQMLRTFALCCIGRVFFRAENMAAAASVFRCMGRFEFTLSGILGPLAWSMSIENIIVSACSVLVLIAVDAVQERTRIRPALAQRGIALRWGQIYLCLFAVLIFGMYGKGYGSAFIYEQF